MIKNKDKILGSLIGFAIGDAMGATTEFMSKEQIQNQYGKVDHIMGGGWLNLRPGSVTDDTQMSLVVYRAMRDTAGHPERTLETICAGFRAWADSNPPDIGGACRRAIYGTKSLKPRAWIWHNKRRQEATKHKDLGNGGLMRCLVPLLAGDLRLAKAQSYLTHSVDIHDTYIELYYEALQDALLGLRPVYPKHMEPTGHVINTERNAEYWCYATASFEEAIIGAVNDGGDADTIAALTGGLAGALYGFEAIPFEWVNALEPEVADELCDCADWLIK